MERAAEGVTCGTLNVEANVGAGAVGIIGAMVGAGELVGGAANNDVVTFRVVGVVCAPPAGVVAGPAVPPAWTVQRAGVAPVRSERVCGALWCITGLLVFQS